MANFVEIVHSGKPVSLQEFSTNNLVIFNDNLNIGSLQTYEGNAGRILDNLRPEDTSLPLGDVIRSGTIIRVPKDNLEKEIIIAAGNLVVPNEDFNAFIDDRIKNIFRDPSYVPVNISTKQHSETLGSIYKIVNKVTVWVWCKSLGEAFGEGKIFDLTPFIYDVTTNVGDNGGNFTLSLAPVVAEFLEPKVPGEKGRWGIKKASLQQFFYNGNKNIVVRDATTFSKGTFPEETKIRKQKYLFNNIISSNDVVFIQFETLENERLEREKGFQALDIGNLIIDEFRLVGRQFDMIGLVDDTDINESEAEADATINVNGRDLMKLLIEDGTYFYPIDWAGATGGIKEATAVNEGGDTNRALKRLVNGELQFFNAFVDRSIDFSLRFIFNLLSNIEICSEKLFSSYPDKTFRYEYAKVIDDGTLSGLQTVPAAGIWQIIKLVIDAQIGERKIVDSSIRSDQGSLLNYVNKVCQRPWVEFYGDTYGDKYYFIARKPPFSKKSYNNLVEETVIDVLVDDIYQQSLKYSDEEIYSWYRLIPLGNFFGDSDDISKALFPAIFFEEFAKIWGSRPMEVVSNYVDFQGIKQEKGTVNLDFLTKQSIQDLAYVIETHAYLPFTRQGTIVLKGDRRIKRGIAVRHTGTGEIFHVDSVTQSYTIKEGTTDRITSLNVSRGMVEEFMTDLEFNYFDIIDLDRDITGASKSLNFKVNTDVFNFFMRREQLKNV